MMTTTQQAHAKKSKFGATMGVSSIIAILVILVLIVFAALSYTTAKADYSLALRTSAATDAYYKADSRAEIKTAELCLAVKQSGWQRSFLTRWAPAPGESMPTLSSEADGAHIVFSEAVGETQELQVELLVAEDGDVSRLRWQLMPVGDWEPDTSLKLISKGS